VEQKPKQNQKESWTQTTAEPLAINSKLLGLTHDFLQLASSSSLWLQRNL